MQRSAPPTRIPFYETETPPPFIIPLTDTSTPPSTDMPTPLAIEILFTPKDRVMSHIIGVVKDAQISIRFLAFSFTDYPLAQVMIDRAKAGVDVRGVYEAFGSNSAGSELRTFWCAGLPVQQDNLEPGAGCGGGDIHLPITSVFCSIMQVNVRER